MTKTLEERVEIAAREECAFKGVDPDGFPRMTTAADPWKKNWETEAMRLRPIFQALEHAPKPEPKEPNPET